jgi:hypothetical protein
MEPIAGPITLGFQRRDDRRCGRLRMVRQAGWYQRISEAAEDESRPMSAALKQPSRREGARQKAEIRHVDRARGASFRQWRSRLYGRAPTLTSVKFLTPDLEALWLANEAKFHPGHTYSDLEIYGADYDLHEAGLLR